MIIKYLLLWFPMVIIAIINGTIRQLFFIKFTDELSAHQLSVISGITFFAIYVWYVTGKWRIDSPLSAIKIGVLWLIMTVIFEFIFGHYVMGNSWQKLLHDYNILEGRLWIVVLFWTTISPFVFYLIRRQELNNPDNP
jgi:uncharacterized membrane protein